MQKSLKAFLRETADLLRDLAQRTPDIAGDLRRFADDLERDAARTGQAERAPGDDE